MIRIMVPFVAVFALAACGGSTNPLGPAAGGGPAGDPGDSAPGNGDPGGITSDRVLPPGTASPSRTHAIRRNEAEDARGNGYARDMRYDRASDTFHVSNLAFDSDNSYSRGTAVASLGPFAVYEGQVIHRDDVTETPIDQFQHRAIYGVSRSGQTEFAVVRTGSFVDYGFGGFAYQRNSGVTLPNTGQAAFQGDYAGLRDFAGIAALEYTTGKMRIDIDFRDFESDHAVKGTVTDRAIYDLAGNDITDQVIQALNTRHGAAIHELPTLRVTFGPGAMDSNGEITGGIGSGLNPARPDEHDYENGKYYAVVAGNEPDEITGIIVVESADPRYPNADVDTSVTARETGGFILYRRP